MPWAKLDDAIYDNVKLVAASPAARWLYIAAICYSRRNQTAGELSLTQMAQLVRGQGLRTAHVLELVREGLLVDLEYAYAIHAYEEFNPLTSTERVRKHRREAKEVPELDDPPSVPETPRNGHETFHRVSRPDLETFLARAPRAGSPVPVPVPDRDLSLATSVPLTPEALAICQAFEARGCTLTQHDTQDAEGMVSDFRVPTAQQFTAEMLVTDTWREENAKAPIARVVGYRDRLRRLNDSLRDAGQKPRELAIPSQT